MQLRTASLALLCLCVVACHRTAEVRGFYAYQNGIGSLLPCDDRNTVVYVPDTVLAARYEGRSDFTSHFAYVRLRGINTRSGSIYSGRPSFVVQEILELRTRTSTDCPALNQTTLGSIIP